MYVLDDKAAISEMLYLKEDQSTFNKLILSFDCLFKVLL